MVPYIDQTGVCILPLFQPIWLQSTARAWFSERPGRSATVVAPYPPVCWPALGPAGGLTLALSVVSGSFWGRGAPVWVGDWASFVLLSSAAISAIIFCMATISS